MQRPMVQKIDEEIQAILQSEKQAKENLFFAEARVNAIRRRIESLKELRARLAEGQLAFDLRPWPDAG